MLLSIENQHWTSSSICAWRLLNLSSISPPGITDNLPFNSSPFSISHLRYPVASSPILNLLFKKSKYWFPSAVLNT